MVLSLRVAACEPSRVERLKQQACVFHDIVLLSARLLEENSGGGGLGSSATAVPLTATWLSDIHGLSRALVPGQLELRAGRGETLPSGQDPLMAPHRATMREAPRWVFKGERPPLLFSV